MENLSIIHKRHHKIIEFVDDEGSGVGVWLKKPWWFSMSEASCTFFDYSNYDSGMTPLQKRKQAIKDLNKCIANEATKIDPKEWDKFFSSLSS